MVEYRYSKRAVPDVVLEKRHQLFKQASERLNQATQEAYERLIFAPDIPLEVLVGSLRSALREQEGQRVTSLLASILQRLQRTNASWARTVLHRLDLPSGEHLAWSADLCAELNEYIIRALRDPARCFWEENFFHSLYFGRKHVYHSFLRREGLGVEARAGRGTRIPRRLLARLDHLRLQVFADGVEELVDVRAQQMLASVEQSDLAWLVLHLPEKLKAVILLCFWEGKATHEVATILSISDRTVRNRLQAALDRLRALLP